MSKYFAFLFLLFFSPLLSTEQSITPYLTSENDTLSIVDGLVNAYNGKVVQIDKDLEIQGTDPLELIRYYDSNFYLLSRWGSRIGLSLPVLLVFNPRTETHNVIVEQRGSSSLIFNAKKQANKRYEGKIEPDFMKFGYTNCCEALLRGEPDLSSMQVSGTEKEFIVDLGNGVKRYYKFFKKKKKEHLFRLESEDLASGNRRFYEYEKKDSSHFTRVWTTNKQCTLTLNWINISYDKKVNTITASNGHTVRYIMEKGKGLFHWGGNIAIEATSDLLKLVSGSHLIDTQYNFVLKAPRQADLFTIKTLTRPADRSFDITYNVDQKVQYVSSSGISTPLYMFFYSPNHTDVKDAQGQTRRYTFDQRRLIKLEEPHRVQHYQWNERGQLVTHTLTGENNHTMSKREYCYDALGNITETKVSGRIKQKDSQDTYSVRYNYSQDGRSNLLSENHNNEKEITYSYSPESNLISRKLTFVNQKCVEREFSEYDENAILIRKIIDDGDASDRDDLTHVSTRRITEIEPQLEAQLFGMTHPKIIKEWYDDPKSGTHVLLKMVEKIYTVGDLVAEERVYDAEQHYRYSLFFEYNSKGELIRETDALGGSTVYAYDANGNKVREERLGSGKKTIYCFDTANRLIQEFEEHSNNQTLATVHTYDAIGNRIGTTNHLSQKTTFQYDAAQREISTTDPLGHSESKEYNALGHMTVQTDKEGHVTKTVSNLYGSPLEIQYTDGTIKSLFYNLEGHLIQTIERDGTSTSYEIDYKGRPTKEKIYGSDGAFLKETLKSYRGSNTISETDSLGNTTFFEYDGAGRKVIEKIGDHIICYAYDSLGRLSTVKTAESLEIKEYDLLDRIVEERIEDHFGNVYKKIQTTYDLNGNCIAQKVYSNPQNFSETQILYNSENLPIAKIDAEGNQTTLLYHYTNQLVKEIIDPLGRKTVEFYDLANRLETIFKYGSDHQLLSHVQFAYDRKGNKTMQKERVLLEAQDLGAYAISFTYNGFDQKLSETEQNVKTTQYTYEKGKLHTITHPDETILTHTYDSLGRLQELTSSDQTIHNRYTYDLNDQLLKAEDLIHHTITERSYDNFGHLIFEKQANGLESRYTYDVLDRLKEMHFSDGKIVYTYSPTYLTSASRYQADRPLYTFTQQTDLTGRMINSLLPNNIAISYAWDALGRCSSIQSAPFQQSFAYDPLGNLIETSVSDPLGSYNSTFTYDPLNQMIQETGPFANQYVFDALNNRRAKNGSPCSIDEFNQMTNDRCNAYSYDKNGRRLSKEDARYSYDALGRLISFTNENQTITYRYDPFGRRMERSDGYSTTTYLYQFDTEIGTFQEGQVKEFRAIYGQCSPFAIELNSQIYAPIRNHRGDICALIDSQGASVTTYRYDSFGEFAHQGVVNSPWLFSGQRYDSATELYHFAKREYDSSLGRWLTPDPLGFADGPNLYAYVHNNPLIYIDPYGLWRENAAQWYANSKNFLGGFSRGFIDDTTFGASSYALGTYSNFAFSSKAGYYAGTGCSMAAGLMYGGTWLKGARYGVKTGLTLLNASKTAFTATKLAKNTLATRNIIKLTQEAKPVFQRIAQTMKGGARNITGKQLVKESLTTVAKTANRNRFTPDMLAEGAHSIFRRDPGSRRTSHYETFIPQTNKYDPKPWESLKRFDGQGKGHRNKFLEMEIQTPHIHDPHCPGGIRQPEFWELPR